MNYKYAGGLSCSKQNEHSLIVSNLLIIKTLMRLKYLIFLMDY